MSKALGLLGYPSTTKEYGAIYPPLVKDVIGNEDAFLFFSIVSQSQEDIWDAIAIQKGETPEGKRYEDAPTPFLLFVQYFLSQHDAMSNGSKPFLKDRILVFSEQSGALLLANPDKLNSVEDVVLIDENNFLGFQNAIRNVMGHKSVEAPDPNEHPKLSKFKAKARYREQVASKAKGDSLTQEEMIIAVCCMHPSISPLNVGELTYPGLLELFHKLNKKEAYDTQVRAATSGFGGGSLKGLKSWMKDD